MTRVDFYILPDTSTESAVVTATRLCDKAAAQGCRIYVHAPDPAEAEDLDGVLWSLRQGSFLAHERHTGAELAEPLPAILIGALEPPDSHHQVLINLGNDVPACFSRFERVCEIVSGDAARRGRSRERYKYYRDRGYELQTHNL
jgi:DNA polymerase III subunit chi